MGRFKNKHQNYKTRLSIHADDSFPMSLPTFRSYVSEKEIDEINKKKQDEWERVRKPDQPLGEGYTVL